MRLNGFLLGIALGATSVTCLENQRALAVQLSDAQSISKEGEQHDQVSLDVQRTGSFHPEVSSRIVGGTVAAKNEFPWFASSTANMGLCGGKSEMVELKALSPWLNLLSFNHSIPDCSKSITIVSHRFKTNEFENTCLV